MSRRAGQQEYSQTFHKAANSHVTISFVGAALKPRSVLMATDFSETSEKALRHALAIARFYESKLCVAHVVSSLSLTLVGAGAIAACEDAALRYAADLKGSLTRSGALSGLQLKFIVRRGEVWPELQEIIRQEGSDLIVIGTHGRNGMRKLFFGSMAEAIFRQADCPVLVFGPNSDERPWIGTSSTLRTFLFATDLGQASLHVLPYAVAAANHFEAKLVVLTVVPAVPPSQSRHMVGDLRQLREESCIKTLSGLAELASQAVVEVRPELCAEFESMPMSERILEAAQRIRADLVIMGVRHRAHAGVFSHVGSDMAYELICHASSPILFVPVPHGK